MNKLIIAFGLIFISTQVFSQPSKDINYLNWSDPIAFKTSPPPAITGYGELSTSLNDNLGNIYFVFGDEYFKIDSWASYYYWFTQKYFFLFLNPEEYEYHYKSKNDREMMRYLAKNYTGTIYPSNIDFRGLNLKNYKMVSANNEDKVNKLKRIIKDSYNQEEEVKYLESRKKLNAQTEKNMEVDNFKKASAPQTSENSNSAQDVKSKSNVKPKKVVKKN